MSLFNSQPSLFNSDNGSIGATAQQLIDKYGVSATCRVITDGAPADADKPWLPTSATTVDHAITVCFVPLSQLLRKTQSQMQASDVTGGMVGAYIGAVGFELTRKCLIINGGIQYRIVDINTTNENDNKILYELTLAP